MTNRTTPPLVSEAPADGLDLMSTLTAPDAPRAVLVSLDGATLRGWPILRGFSVLDLEVDLFNHLSAMPLKEAFLVELRDYCQARLEARAAARKTGGIAVPGDNKTWGVMPIPGIPRVEVH